MRSKSAKTGAGQVVTLAPTRPIRLANAEDVRVEAASLYRAAKRGEIPLSDATRLAYLLGIVVKAIETSRLEAKLLEIEQLMEGSCNVDS